jgi:hypothetical protein
MIAGHATNEGVVIVDPTSRIGGGFCLFLASATPS